MSKAESSGDGRDRMPAIEVLIRNIPELSETTETCDARGWCKTLDL